MTVHPDHFRLDAADRVEVHPAIAVTPDAPRRSEPRYTRIEIGGFRRPAVIAMLAVLFFASVGDFVNAKTVFDLEDYSKVPSWDRKLVPNSQNTRAPGTCE